ncbi:hypothetical protein PH213_20630 [Streptomyces sp. SRF1]|uniref:hypothetical protein n=1 Tax=Streptomyces sp. SRF1 TaxID=1549642 RepID=UPI0025B1A6EC|nr:hypothetical protein [Streptomyces sp. SRF1]MDN3056913.1 hypothetical protein [Streptomyces sp. SRF1]
MITAVEIAAALDDAEVSNLAVARRLGVGAERVRSARAKAGVPAYRRGRRRVYATWAEAFAARTVAVEGGHLHWTGARSPHGTPVLHLGLETRTAYRHAFRAEYGRDPVGNVAPAPGCGYGGCVAGAHLEDRLMREARRRTGAGA